MLPRVDFSQSLNRLMVAKVICPYSNALHKRGRPCAKTGLFERDHCLGQISFRVEGSRTYIDIDHELVE